MPSVVGTTTVDEAVTFPFQRKTFFALRQFWVFYSDGSDVVWRTSANGINWSDPKVMRVGVLEGRVFSIWFDDTFIHYAISTLTAIYYRRGLVNIDGTITWTATEQTAVIGPLGGEVHHPFVSVDSDGYPFIVYSETADVSNYFNYATKSSTNDGTWSTQGGFPFQLSGPWLGNIPSTSIAPLNNARMFAVYLIDGQQVHGRLWTGSAWGAQETASTGFTAEAFGHSVVAEGNDIHVVWWGEGGGDFNYNKRTFGVGWGAEFAVDFDADTPTMCIMGSTLFVFYKNFPNDNHIYYKRRIAGVWDSARTDFINETSETLLDYYTCFYKAAGALNDLIGITYSTKQTSPYNVKFEFLGTLPEKGFGDGFIWVS